MNSMTGIGGRMGEAELLAWYVAVGADEAIGDESLGWLTQPGPPAPAARPAPMPARPAPAAPPAQQQAAAGQPPVPRSAAEPAMTGMEAVRAARQAALAAQDLAQLRQAVLDFDGCALKKTATNTVFADGNPAAPLMLVGEAPGADEDRLGRPFVGVSGRLLDRMLATIGIDRTSAYITNMLFWRPPGNRKPTDLEIDICRPFVERHIALVRPRVLVLVGGTASAAMMPGSQGITRLRGRWMSFDCPGLEQPVQVMAMYHPSFLLRSPERKRDSWADLLLIKSKLKHD